MLSPDIRDQAYQFFIEEAPELLEAIERGLLSLREDRSTAKVHEIMRAAHSIKGGAASVELELIKVIAHRLETIFKSLYDETVEIDATLESQLLQAYDCLRLPLMEQLETGHMDIEQALAEAEPIFVQLEERLADSLLKADDYLPTSSDLGIDMVASIFEIDVEQGIERLIAVSQQPDLYPIAGEVQAQAEVFIGLAELLNLPGFGKIAQTALTALEANPDQALQILKLALTDFELGRAAVLKGDRAEGGQPSAALLALSQPVAAAPEIDSMNLTAVTEVDSLALEDMFTSDTAQDLLLEPVAEDKYNFSELMSGGAESAELEFEDSDMDTASGSVDWETVNFPMASLEAGLAEGELEEGGLEQGGFEENRADHSFESLVEEEDESEVLDDSETSLELLENVFGDKSGHVSLDVADPSAEDLFADDLLSWQDESSVEVSVVYESITENESAEVKVEGSDEVKIETEISNPDAVPALPTLSVENIDKIAIEGNIENVIQSAEELFSQLPSLADQPEQADAPAVKQTEDETAWKQYLRPSQTTATTAKATNLSVRVDLHRLERMNNLVGELAINRNSLSLQNEQLQRSVHDLVERFDRFQVLIGGLRDLSDQMLVAPATRNAVAHQMGLFNVEGSPYGTVGIATGTALLESFDSLEMDRYSGLHFQLQEIFEQAMQLEEVMGDVGLFAGQSNQTLTGQRQKLTQLQNELMWARMLPLGNVLNRFPRVLRDLSTKYNKMVSLKLSGTSVLVDKVVLEKLYDPLLHLLRNAFDHGIEMPELRQQRGKSQQGTIEVRAYHRGNQTLIDIIDDGRGLDLKRIGQRAVELGWLPAEQLEDVKPAQLLSYIFEPGFSTASQVSELSGRGVGLDVVRAQLRSLKGSVTVNSVPGQGTTFTLSIPLTLTIAKLLSCRVGVTSLAVPSDSIEEILVPRTDQIKRSGNQQFLYWRDQLVPIYRMGHLLNYACTMPESSTSDALTSTPAPKEWALPLLVIQRAQHSFALEVDRLITEQELVIKPFGSAIASPAYTYGCTILGDGSLIPVIDAGTLVDLMVEPNSGEIAVPRAALNTLAPSSHDAAPLPSRQAKTIMVVDDAATLRRMLALTLEKAGYRVLQARDGQEAMNQLQQGSSVQLVICDIEMPNMNGFEFLSQRRQNPVFAEIPVVMLTSRSNDKHRRLAMHLGATSYFSKPYIEHELLGALKTLLEVKS